MRLPGPKGEPQRLPGAKEVCLAYDFVDRAWTKPVSQRGLGFTLLEKIIH
jgi:hypothetical protein